MNTTRQVDSTSPDFDHSRANEVNPLDAEMRNPKPRHLQIFQSNVNLIYDSFMQVYISRLVSVSQILGPSDTLFLEGVRLPKDALRQDTAINIIRQ